jgi:hypothetical protein
MPRWQVAVFGVIMAVLLSIIAADVLGFAPRPQGRTGEFARLEANVAEIRTDQEKTRAELLADQARLRADQESLRREMHAGFESLRSLLKEKKQP